MNILYNTIFINGQAFNCSSIMSLRDLLVYLDFNIYGIVVEYNSEIIPNHQFSSIRFKNQDKVEIITIVGGG